MTDADTSGLPGSSGRRRLLGAVYAAVIVLALGYAVSRNWQDFVDSWRRIGVIGSLGALALGALGVAATWLQWRTVLMGLGVDLEVTTSARVFFVSQLGKYLPGSIWPVVLQMESARRRGADRGVVVAANVIVLAVSLTTGLVLAGLLLPFSVPSALGRFWWALASLPLLALAVHPATLPRVLDFCLHRLGRPSLGVRLSASATLRAMLWSVLSWLALGGQTTLLCAAVGAHGAGLYALATGGIALALCAGILFVPAPAGAGPREVVLAYVLATVLSTGAALAVVVASRVILIATDLLLGLTAGLITRRDQAGPSKPLSGRQQPSP